MYLQKLTDQLSEGMARLPEEVRARHTRYLLSFQAEDGGFTGREGGSDLYYTGFALRSLAVLNELETEVAENAGRFLRSCLTQSASIVDFYSLLYSCLLVQLVGGPAILDDSPEDWPDRVAETLETFRTSDGGYGKATNSASGSTYHTFLVGMCYELLGRDFPDPDGVIQFVASRRRDDGGYVEIAPMRRSGTNPTAAAVGIVQIIQGGNSQPKEMQHVVEFLSHMPSLEGGLCANTRIPVADLLSTFTGAWTLAQLGALNQIDTKAVTAYAQSLERPQGGFRGGIWDKESDVEYTFYGIGTFALVSS